VLDGGPKDWQTPRKEITKGGREGGREGRREGLLTCNPGGTDSTFTHGPCLILHISTIPLPGE